MFRALPSTATVACFGFSATFCTFFFFNIITNILENVLSPENKSAAHHNVYLALYLVLLSHFRPRGDDSLALSSALVGLAEQTLSICKNVGVHTDSSDRWNPAQPAQKSRTTSQPGRGATPWGASGSTQVRLAGLANFDLVRDLAVSYACCLKIT